MISELLLLGVLQVTSYRAVPEQTKPECKDRLHCTTSIDDTMTMFGAAASQDLLKSGRLHYGDVIFVPGYGYRTINDCMNARLKNSIDLFVLTRNAEKQVGVRHLKIYRVQEPK